MNRELIKKLTDKAMEAPKLKYDEDIFKFRDNVQRAIKAVKRRLGDLQILNAEIEYELTLNHMDDEES